MHFGEYELSPGLIGLSLLPSGHPKAFQRIPVRTSRRCYPSFILPKGRSPGFASSAADSNRPVRTRFRSGSGIHPPSEGFSTPTGSDLQTVLPVLHPAQG